MMIRWLNRSEIDDARWNECIKSADSFRHYTLTYFLDATAERWEALVKGDYDWVWPVPVKTKPLSQVMQPLLAQQLGPYPVSNVSQADIEAVWQMIRSKYWKANVKFNDHFSKLPMRFTSNTNVELALSEPYQTIKGGYKRNAQSNIKKAESAKVEVSHGAFFDDQIIEFFQSGKGSKLEVLDNAFYHHVESIYRSFLKRGEAETWVAKLDDELLGGVMLLTTNARLLNFFTAASDKARDCGAMHYIFDSIIRHYSCQKMVLDFEGSNDKNLAYFYKSFGGNERVYLQAQTSWRPPIVNRLFH